jgi:prepilin-type processing-associated H-X9-DG protein
MGESMDPKEPLEYAGPDTIRRTRPLFAVPAGVTRAAGITSILVSIPGFIFYRSHMIERSCEPQWWQIVTPIATAIALPLAGIALLRDRGARRAGVAFGTVAIFLSGALSFGMIFGTRLVVDCETADRVKCASNLRQVGQALRIYTAHHRGLYPPDLPTLYLQVPDMAAECLICPLSGNRPAVGDSRSKTAAMIGAGGHCSYIYCGGGMNSSVALTTIIAFEPMSNHSGEGSNVLFADGHVAWLTPKDLKKALVAPTTGPASTQPSAGRDRWGGARAPVLDRRATPPDASSNNKPATTRASIVMLTRSNREVWWDERTGAGGPSCCSLSSFRFRF